MDTIFQPPFRTDLYLRGYRRETSSSRIAALTITRKCGFAFIAW